MYCVVQEIQNKKQNNLGAYKEIEVYSFNVMGKDVYSYRFVGERCERTNKTAYKVTVRESHRVEGKVKAKVWTLGTFTYYSMCEYGYYEDIERPIQRIADETGKSFDEIYSIVEKKLDPIFKRIRSEYEQSEEYKVNQKNIAITQKYVADKAQFERVYGRNTYDYCYDVFGTLRNTQYLEILKMCRRYHEGNQSNYNSSEYQKNLSSYQSNLYSNYNEEERKKLKKCFKVLAKYFHPDSSTGDTEIMKFLNDRLKKDWNI